MGKSNIPKMTIKELEDLKTTIKSFRHVQGDNRAYDLCAQTLTSLRHEFGETYGFKKSEKVLDIYQYQKSDILKSEIISTFRSELNSAVGDWLIAAKLRNLPKAE